VRSKCNKICEKYNASYTKYDRVVGEKWSTVDTSKRRWKLTEAARKGGYGPCGNGRL
jgi:hypothetical protein